MFLSFSIWLNFLFFLFVFSDSFVADWLECVIRSVGALETSAPPTNVNISTSHHNNTIITTSPSHPHYLLNGLAVVREAWYLVLSAELALRAQPVVELSFACHDNL